jgi:hypothetical protein
MQARLSRLRYLFSASTLLALLLLTQSIAETHAQTSESTARRASSVTAWSPLPWFEPLPAKPIPSSQKRKKTTLAASITEIKPAAPRSKILPAVDKNDIKPNHRTLADMVLRSLPSRCRNNLKNFYVRYDNPTSRGLGGKSTIILDGTVPDAEFIALLVHECGHVIHSNLQGNPASGTSAYRDGKLAYYNDSPIVSFMSLSWETENILREDAAPNRFFSGYAQSDAHEDFSETFAAYVLLPEYAASMAKSNPILAAKLQWMKENLPLEKTIAATTYAWDGEIPWDVTKLPYRMRD